MIFDLRCNLVHRGNHVELLELKSRSSGAQHCDLYCAKPETFILLMFNLACNTLCNAAGKSKHEDMAAGTQQRQAAEQGEHVSLCCEKSC